MDFLEIGLNRLWSLVRGSRERLGNARSYIALHMALQLKCHLLAQPRQVKDGLYPRGWGNWSIIEGKLWIEDLTGEGSVYSLPVTHGGNFVLETKVKLVQGNHSVYTAAQLPTRDCSKENYESGMVLLLEFDQAIVRHMADRIGYVYKAFEIIMSINYGEWYVMRLIVLNGRTRASVDGNEIYDSNSSFPVTAYE